MRSVKGIFRSCLLWQKRRCWAKSGGIWQFAELLYRWRIIVRWYFNGQIVRGFVSIHAALSRTFKSYIVHSAFTCAACLTVHSGKMNRIVFVCFGGTCSSPSSSCFITHPRAFDTSASLVTPFVFVSAIAAVV